MIILCNMTILISIFSWFFVKEPAKSYNEIIQSHEKYANDKFDFKSFYNGYSYPDKFSEISIGFKTMGPGEIKKSRKIIIDLANDLLKRINNQEALQNYLSNRPFTVKNISISITFTDDKGRSWIKSDVEGNNDDLTDTTLSNGRIIYYILLNRKGPSTIIFEETYEEALKRVSETD